MRLSALMLTNVCSVNHFEYVGSFQHTDGVAETMYFQLVDLDQPVWPGSKGNQPLRYMPASGATLSVLLHNIDASLSQAAMATQPYANDPSIWSVPLQASWKLGSNNIHLTLTEGAVVKKGVVIQGIKTNPVDPSTISSC